MLYAKTNSNRLTIKEVRKMKDSELFSKYKTTRLTLTNKIKIVNEVIRRGKLLKSNKILQKKNKKEKK